MRSRTRCTACGSALARCLRLPPDRRLHRVEGLFKQRFRYRERGLDPEDVVSVAAPEGNGASFDTFVEDRTGRLGVRHLGPLVLHEFDADAEAEPSYVADEIEVLPLLHALEGLRAELRGPLGNPIAPHHVEGPRRGDAGGRGAAERRARGDLLRAHRL